MSEEIDNVFPESNGTTTNITVSQDDFLGLSFRSTPNWDRIAERYREAIKSYEQRATPVATPDYDPYGLEVLSPAKSSSRVTTKVRIGDYYNAGVDNPIETKDVNWVDDYNKLSSKKEISRASKKVKFSPKTFYTLDECLKAYQELTEKDFAKICLTGSIALYLQGKIARDRFKDVDIIVVGDYTLDDDMNDIQRNRHVKDEKLCESRAISYLNTPFDMFLMKDDSNLKTVTVVRDGVEYVCQDYRDIIRAKLIMCMQSMKDSDELFEKHFNLSF